MSIDMPPKLLWEGSNSYMYDFYLSLDLCEININTDIYTLANIVRVIAKYCNAEILLIKGC